MTIAVRDPTSGQTVEEHDPVPPESLNSMVGATAAAQRAWARTPIRERSPFLRAVAEVLRRRRDDLAQRMAREMGKPVTQGRAEVDKCALVCDYYADEAPRFLDDESLPGDSGESFVAHRPLGVILAVMPWNFPLWQVFRFAAPALMAGNGALLKHASNVPGCALAIGEVLNEAGLPDNLFRPLLIDADAVDALIEDRRIRGVTLTGSDGAGRAVAAKAGACLKKTVLELGGSDPYVVLADADLEAAAEICARSRLINSGQSCIAAKRFIVVESIVEEFTVALVERMEARRVGPPLDEEVDVGPLAREDLREELHCQVCDSVERGARCLVGGDVPRGPGFFYPPTVLDRVRPGMPAFDEELFGPVAAVVQAPTRTRPSTWRTTRRMVWAPPCSPPTRPVAAGSPPKSWRRGPAR